MVITAMPVFLCPGSCNEKSVSTIAEQEHNFETEAKELLKYSDYKYADIYFGYHDVQISQVSGLKKCLIAYYNRYLSSHHPPVLTPPPNSLSYRKA